MTDIHDYEGKLQSVEKLIDRENPILPASIRKTLLVAERLGLTSRRDAVSKAYQLTDLGKKEVEWIKELAELLGKLERTINYGFLSASIKFLNEFDTFIIFSMSSSLASFLRSVLLLT